MTLCLHTPKHNLSDEQLDTYIRRTPQPLTGLGQLKPEQSEFRLRASLASVVEPTAQIRLLLRNLLTVAAEYGLAHYSEEDAFRKQCYQTNLTSEQPKLLICLTGLSNTGKSGVLGALVRILNEGSKVIALDNLPVYRQQALWPMTMENGVTLPTLLRPFLSEVLAPEQKMQWADLLQVASKTAHTRGVSLIFVDEFQFISTGQDAHANAAKVLLQLSRLGPPLVYCVNYDMVARLEKRPQQERSRLFKKMFFLYPDPADSVDWHATLGAQLSVAVELCCSDNAISVAQHASMIHHFTFGIKGYSAKLFLIAYRCARQRGREYVAPVDVEEAYRSRDYHAEREDVEFLKLQVIKNKPQRGDLWCNFASPAFVGNYIQESNAMTTEATMVVQADRAIAEHKSRVLESYAKSSLDPEAREAMEYLQDSASGHSGKTAKVVKLKRPRVTKEELLSGFSDFRDQDG